VRRLVVATNRNDILARFFATGVYERGEVVPTRSPSMDIQVASNFERLLFELEDQDGSRVRAQMAQFAETGRLLVEPGRHARCQAEFAGGRADEETVLQTIREVYAATGIIIDPHTAVGIAVGRQVRRAGEGPLICLATAHPAKFPDAVREAIGILPPTPPQLRDLDARPERFEVVPADRDLIAARIRRFVHERR
jgi:threonine synthase